MVFVIDYCFIFKPIKIKQFTIKCRVVQILITFPLEVIETRCAFNLLSEIKLYYKTKVETCVSLDFKWNKGNQQVDSSREEFICIHYCFIKKLSFYKMQGLCMVSGVNFSSFLPSQREDSVLQLIFAS